MITQSQETPIIIQHKGGGASGVAAFIFGLLSIFFLAPVFVPLAGLLGIVAIFNRQAVWGILGLICASIGFVTSPILLGIFAAATIVANVPHTAAPSAETRQQTYQPVQKQVSRDDMLVEGAKLCTQYLPRHERAEGIPEHLLAAIAAMESGQYHKALGLPLPWPWTVKAEGIPHFYDTKEQAIEEVQSLEARGVTDISVGCMQVNLLHHPHAFANLDQAFDPAYNVAYLSLLLRQHFQTTHSWRNAVAQFDSSTGLQGDKYSAAVYEAWSNIINKVADARAGRPILTATVQQPAQIKRVSDETNAAITECKNKRLTGALPTFVASAKCSNTRIVQAYQDNGYPYMDLVGQLVAKRLEVAERLDAGKLTEGEAQLEYAEFITHITDLERQRNAAAR